MLIAVAIVHLPAYVQPALSRLHAFAAVVGVHRTLSVGGPACIYTMHSLAAAATTALGMQAAMEKSVLCFDTCDYSYHSYYSSCYLNKFTAAVQYEQQLQQ
jgi:hypothetical protein